MAWVSPRVYAILSKSEEGKDIIEQLPDMTQDECQVELDRFFGEGGKGASSSKEYGQAKFDDEAEEEMYKAIGDEEVSEKDYEEEPKIEKKYGYNPWHEDESKLTRKEAAALKYMYGTQITDEEMKSITDDEIKRAVDYYDWTLSKYTDDERAYVINQEKKDFNIGKTVPAREKGFGWKKTKMASGVLYEGPNGEREMK